MTAKMLRCRSEENSVSLNLLVEGTYNCIYFTFEKHHRLDIPFRTPNQVARFEASHAAYVMLRDVLPSALSSGFSASFNVMMSLDPAWSITEKESFVTRILVLNIAGCQGNDHVSYCS